MKITEFSKNKSPRTNYELKILKSLDSLRKSITHETPIPQPFEIFLKNSTILQNTFSQLKIMLIFSSNKKKGQLSLK